MNNHSISIVDNIETELNQNNTTLIGKNCLRMECFPNRYYQSRTHTTFLNHQCCLFGRIAMNVLVITGLTTIFYYLHLNDETSTYPNMNEQTQINKVDQFKFYLKKKFIILLLVVIVFQIIFIFIYYNWKTANKRSRTELSKNRSKSKNG